MLGAVGGRSRIRRYVLKLRYERIREGETYSDTVSVISIHYITYLDLLAIH